MNLTSNNGWKRAAAWGEYFQECRENIDCFNALNASRQAEVLDYSCKKVSVYSNSSVCLCNMRQLKQGVNCNEYTMYTLHGAPLRVLVLCFLIYVAVKSVRTTWVYRGKRNTVLAALVLASIQVISLIGWTTGMLIRNLATIAPVYHAADVMGKFVSVPIACVTLMMEHGVIVVAWERSIGKFKRRTKRAKRAMIWFERMMMVYLVVVPITVLYFNLRNNYNGTSIITALSLILFTAGFVLIGCRLRNLLVFTASQNVSDIVARGNIKSSSQTVNFAIKAIQEYIMWIALGSFLAVVSMVFFSVAEGVGVYSTAEGVFHPDLIAEPLIALATGNCSRNIVNYILASRKKAYYEEPSARRNTPEFDEGIL